MGASLPRVPVHRPPSRDRPGGPQRGRLPALGPGQASGNSHPPVTAGQVARGVAGSKRPWTLAMMNLDLRLCAHSRLAPTLGLCLPGRRRNGRRGGMKLVTAIVKPHRLDELIESVIGSGGRGVTVSEVRGWAGNTVSSQAASLLRAWRVSRTRRCCPKSAWTSLSLMTMRAAWLTLSRRPPTPGRSAMGRSG